MTAANLKQHIRQVREVSVPRGPNDDLQSERSDDDWRWQFLRRAPEYRQSWCDHSSAPDLARVAIAATFGLRDLVDPDLNQVSDIFSPPDPVEVANASSAELDHWRATARVLLRFDLRNPIAGQLARAGELLEQAQEFRGLAERQRRRYRQAWTQYLAVLDLKASSETWSELAELLDLPEDSDGVSRARQLWQRARQVQEDLMRKAPACSSCSPAVDSGSLAASL